MKQNFILMIILLTMLSMVNTIPHQLFYKRETTFVPCPTGSPNPVTVFLQSDPLVAGETDVFNINGMITNGSIDTGSELVITLLDKNDAVVGDPFTFLDICTTLGLTCPVTVGTSFSLTPNVQAPGTLPAIYDIIVQIFDVNGDIIACDTSAVTAGG